MRVQAAVLNTATTPLDHSMNSRRLRKSELKGSKRGCGFGPVACSSRLRHCFLPSLFSGLLIGGTPHSWLADPLRNALWERFRSETAYRFFSILRSDAIPSR